MAHSPSHLLLVMKHMEFIQAYRHLGERRYTYRYNLVTHVNVLLNAKFAYYSYSCAFLIVHFLTVIILVLGGICYVTALWSR